MESYKIRNLSFAYPGKDKKALSDINLTINKGEFVLICGLSGCGKTTFLRLLKPSLAPHGQREGSIIFDGRPLEECTPREGARKIGFVMQSPENQHVTDKVWHELSFGLESLGLKTPEIRARVSEMASFFGIQAWFYKSVAELSGGQKQMLNLASAMVLQPEVLVLDEPSSQLDPISASELLSALVKINRELGTTIIMTEHRTEEVFCLADRVVVMDRGKIIADSLPREVGKILKEKNHPMYRTIPTPMRVRDGVSDSGPCPLTVREGRAWLEKYSRDRELKRELIPGDREPKGTPVAVEIKDVSFRYQKDMPDVIKGLSLTVCKGELFCLLGGNGTGKTTALSLIAGLGRPRRGSVLVKEKPPYGEDNCSGRLVALLPQQPRSIFVKNTLYADLMEIMEDKTLSFEEKDLRVRAMAQLCRVEGLLAEHPYDLSGGEEQRAALAKVLLTEPEVLLLDEPTKGMDAGFKEEFADILEDLKSGGMAIIMVSHDIEFCAGNADVCALMFDGCITSQGAPREFFRGKSFYTTIANRMARDVLPEAVVAEDIILALGGNIEKRQRRPVYPPPIREKVFAKDEESKKPLSPGKKVGIVSALIFVLCVALSLMTNYRELSSVAVAITEGIKLVSFGLACCLLFPSGSGAGTLPAVSVAGPPARAVPASAGLLAAIPITIFGGVFLFGDRRYYFVSLLVILEAMVPFFMIFEARRPRAREIMTVSVLCAVAVAGRGAFYMLPQFKPVTAIVIIAGICFGGETGFLVGAITGFVSNFFFGHGPWTPWQMFALGIIGFVSGILFARKILPRNRAFLCLYGFVVTLVFYGGIMNPASVIMVQSHVTWQMIGASYVAGLPLDIVHALSTAFFLWFIAEPMTEKLERVKTKYGLM